MVLFLTLSAMTYSIVHVATEYLQADRRLSHNTKYTFYRLQNLLLQLILQVIQIGLTLTQAFLRIFLKKIVSSLRYIPKRLEGKRRVSFQTDHGITQFRPSCGIQQHVHTVYTPKRKLFTSVSVLWFRYHLKSFLF